MCLICRATHLRATVHSNAHTVLRLDPSRRQSSEIHLFARIHSRHHIHAASCYYHRLRHGSNVSCERICSIVALHAFTRLQRHSPGDQVFAPHFLSNALFVATWHPAPPSHPRASRDLSQRRSGFQSHSKSFNSLCNSQRDFLDCSRRRPRSAVGRSRSFAWSTDARPPPQVLGGHRRHHGRIPCVVDIVLDHRIWSANISVVLALVSNQLVYKGLVLLCLIQLLVWAEAVAIMAGLSS